MKIAHTYLLIANMYLIASFFKEGITSLFLILLGGVWILASILFLNFENSIDRLERRNEHMKFKIIMDLLCEIARIKVKEKLQRRKKK